MVRRGGRGLHGVVDNDFAAKAAKLPAMASPSFDVTVRLFSPAVLPGLP